MDNGSARHNALVRFASMVQTIMQRIDGVSSVLVRASDDLRATLRAHRILIVLHVCALAVVFSLIGELLDLEDGLRTIIANLRCH